VLVAIVVVGCLIFAGPSSHNYTFIFQNAGQLVKGNEVRIAGRSIGKVDSIALTDDNRAAIKVSVNEPYAPLRHGTTALIRSGSLSGQANATSWLALGADNAPSTRTGTRSGRTRRPRPSTSTSSSRRSTQRPARACRT